MSTDLQHQIQLHAYHTAEHAPFEWSRGPHVALLVHGFPGTPAEMRPIGRIFADAGWSVRGLLLPGFGAEFPTLGDKRCSDWDAAIDAALTDLRRRYVRVVVAGNSLGGALALRAATAHPVDGVVLFAPFWRVDNWLDALFPVAERVFPHIRPFARANFADPGLRTELRHFLTEVDLDDPMVQAGIRRLTLPTRVIGQVRRAGQVGYQVAGAVTAPVLIFQGRRDPLVKPWRTQRLARRLPNLAGYLEINGEHDLVRGVAPEWSVIATVLRTFIAQLTVAHVAHFTTPHFHEHAQ
ncbi:MAG TPA: alpha/beta fold hydrolase [Chloroflexi bacterium]|nr:alpha/beta fold hydrolase [Chloroflexota bacterium]